MEGDDEDEETDEGVTLQQGGSRGDALRYVVSAVDGVQELWRAVVFIRYVHDHLQGAYDTVNDAGKKRGSQTMVAMHSLSAPGGTIIDPVQVCAFLKGRASPDQR